MGKLIYTENIGFSLRDWEAEPICKVYAGTNCIMAITDDGRVLQKVKDESIAARTRYWTRIRQIAVSKCYEGVAIGLVSDGTCMIAKRPIRSACEYSRQNFDDINETVKSWHDIVQVAASDALFALDSGGRVHYSYYSHRRQYPDDYRDVVYWENVVKIATAAQNAVLGVTKDGKVLFTGANSAHSNLKQKLEKITDAVDVYPTGGECETVVIARRDGSLVNERGDLLPEGRRDENAHYPRLKVPADPLDQVLEGTFYYTVIGKTPEGTLFPVINRFGLDLDEKHISNYRIRSFALGDINYSKPFLIAVSE